MAFRNPVHTLPASRITGQITSGQIEDGAVIAGKLGPSAVQLTNIANAAVDAQKIADAAVIAGKIAAGSVGTNELSAGAVTTAKLTAGAVTTAALAAGAVTTGTLAANAVVAGKIGASAVDTGQLVAGSVTTDRIASGAVTTTQLAAGSVATDRLAAGAVTTDRLAAGAVTTAQLAAGSVTTDQIAAGAVTTPQLAAGSVTTDRLTVGLGGSVGQKFYDTGAEAARWSVVGGTAPTSVQVADSQAGGYVMRAVGYTGALYRSDMKIPFDPGVLYRVTAVVRQTADNSTPGTNQGCYVGLMGWAANGTSMVNRNGANATTSQHFFAASNSPLTTGAGFVRYTGYVRGWAAVGGTGTAAPTPSPLAPGVMHSLTRYISPILFLNYTGGTGTAEVDLVTIEVVETGSVGTVNIGDGTVTASKIEATAINGKTVTGATVQTAASGRRIVLAPDGNTYWYTGATGEFAPGRIQSEGGATPSLSLYGPRMDDMLDYGIKLTETGASTSAVVDTDTTTVIGDMAVAGNFSAGNIAWGSVSITPTPDTDTSVTVTGVNLNSLGSYRVFLTVNSAFPSVLRAATATGATSDGFTLWINRSTNASTNVWWLMLAK